MQSFHDFQLKSITGEDVTLSKYAGQHALLVNVASECGYTPQYADLQLFHQEYYGKVAMLGIPSNDFGAQEPGSDAQILDFCQTNFGVSFDLFSKISVTGPRRDPLYGWLAEESGNEPTWNFCKYLIDPNGKVLGFYTSGVNPFDEAITSQLN